MDITEKAIPEKETTSLRSKAFSAAKKVAEAFLPIDTKLVPKDITDKTTALIINRYLGNPVQENVMGNDRWINPFSIVHVLSFAGYVPTFERDYQKKFPEAYAVTRKALTALVGQDVLETITTDQPDINHEQTRYKVVDKELLKKFADEGKEEIRQKANIRH